jgi:hypothetical protein
MALLTTPTLIRMFGEKSYRNIRFYRIVNCPGAGRGEWGLMMQGVPYLGAELPRRPKVYMFFPLSDSRF